MSLELYNCTLSIEAQQCARDDLHEKEEKHNENICEVLEWLKTQNRIKARTGK